MKRYCGILLFVSSIVYSLAFLFNDYLWWLIFVFPIPFLYVAMQERLSFKHGFVWGLSLLLLHMIGGICVVAHMAHNSWLCGLILALSMVIVQATFIGILFYACGHLFHSVQHLCAVIMTLFLTITWLDRYCLFMFDVVEGYPLIHPLIVLTRCPPLLYLLPIIGKNCLTLLFLLLPASITALFVYKNKLSCLLCLCALLPWYISLWFGSATPQTCPEWVKHIKVMPYMAINHCANAQSAFFVAQYDINNFVDKHANHFLYILPESSIYVDEQLCSVEALMTQNKNIIFGATRMHDSACFNVLYWVCNGAVRYSFEKCHTMVLSERLPFFLRNEGIKRMYFDSDKYETSMGMLPRKKMTIDGVGSFVPYICSEFFFAEYPDDPFGDTPILVLVNDSVFLQHPCSRYICVLLQLLAQFKAMQWQREIIYVSYSQSFYCDKGGCKILM